MVSCQLLGRARRFSPATGTMTGVADPTGFTYEVRKNGEIVLAHHGRKAVVLRGRRADKFISQLATRNPQELMARATGNYKRGNERS